MGTTEDFLDALEELIEADVDEVDEVERRKNHRLVVRMGDGTVYLLRVERVQGPEDEEGDDDEDDEDDDS